MNIEINACKLTLELIDTETGELITKEATLGNFKDVVKKTSTPRTKKSKDDDEPIPMIHVLDGKWQLNTKAQELCGFEPETKLEIKFEKKGRVITPILCEDLKSGNRLTKTYTVSCRGSKRDNLLEYGDTFEVIPYEDKPGYFKLKGNAPEKEDDIIDIPEEIENPEEFEDELNIDSVDIDNISFDFE